MPHRHFHLRSGNWRDETGLEFAESLSRGSATEQVRVCGTFGLDLAYRGGRFEVDSDGTKFGVGGFTTDSGVVSFEIEPKTEGFEIAGLMEALAYLHRTDEILTFGDPVIGPRAGNSTSENMDLPFLLRLESLLCSFDARSLLTANTRRLVPTGAKLRGRPDSKALALNVSRGILRFNCAVLDNHRQRLVATLFYRTLIELGHLIETWKKLTHMNLPRQKSEIGRQLSLLGNLALPEPLPDVLRETIGPPFPLGTRDLVRECRRFWSLRHRIGIEDSNRGPGYITMVVNAALAFEIYALAYLSLRLPHHQKLKLQGQPYFADFGDPSNNRNLSIKPDHLLFDETRRDLKILEVKYSLQIAERAHVSQLLSYLKYSGYEIAVDTISGILIYPANKFDFGRIVGFDAELRIALIPVSRQALLGSADSTIEL